MTSEYDTYKKEHSLFTWTKPVGYDFVEVDKTIHDYKQTISDVYEIIAERDNAIAILEAKNADLIKELTLANIRLDELQVPTYTEQQSIEILNDFNQIDGQQSQQQPQQQVQAQPQQQPQQVEPQQQVQAQPQQQPQQQPRQESSVDNNLQASSNDNLNNNKKRVVSHIIGAITYDEIKQQTDGSIIM